MKNESRVTCHEREGIIVLRCDFFMRHVQPASGEYMYIYIYMYIILFCQISSSPGWSTSPWNGEYALLNGGSCHLSTMKFWCPWNRMNFTNHNFYTNFADCTFACYQWKVATVPFSRFFSNTRNSACLSLKFDIPTNDWISASGARPITLRNQAVSLRKRHYLWVSLPSAFEVTWGMLRIWDISWPDKAVWLAYVIFVPIVPNLYCISCMIVVAAPALPDKHLFILPVQPL